MVPSGFIFILYTNIDPMMAAPLGGWPYAMTFRVSMEFISSSVAMIQKGASGSAVA